MQSGDAGCIGGEAEVQRQQTGTDHRAQNCDAKHPAPRARQHDKHQQHDRRRGKRHRDIERHHSTADSPKILGEICRCRAGFHTQDRRALRDSHHSPKHRGADEPRDPHRASPTNQRNRDHDTRRHDAQHERGPQTNRDQCAQRYEEPSEHARGPHAPC